MRYKNIISYLEQVEASIRDNPGSVVDFDVQEITSLYEMAKNRDKNKVGIMEKKFSKYVVDLANKKDSPKKVWLVAKLKNWIDPVRSVYCRREGIEIQSEKSKESSEYSYNESKTGKFRINVYDEIANSRSNNPSNPIQQAESSDAIEEQEYTIQDDYVASLPPIPPAPTPLSHSDSSFSPAPAPAPSPSLKPWNIDTDEDENIEELNSIEMRTATILANLKDRYVI